MSRTAVISKTDARFVPEIFIPNVFDIINNNTDPSDLVLNISVSNNQRSVIDVALRKAIESFRLGQKREEQESYADASTLFFKAATELTPYRNYTIINDMVIQALWKAARLIGKTDASAAADASFELGRMYENGQVASEPMYNVAARLFKKAANRDHQDAKLALRRVNMYLNKPTIHKLENRGHQELEEYKQSDEIPSTYNNRLDHSKTNKVVTPVNVPANIPANVSANVPVNDLFAGLDENDYYIEAKKQARKNVKEGLDPRYGHRWYNPLNYGYTRRAYLNEYKTYSNESRRKKNRNAAIAANKKREENQKAAEQCVASATNKSGKTQCKKGPTRVLKGLFFEKPKPLRQPMSLEQELEILRENYRKKEEASFAAADAAARHAALAKQEAEEKAAALAQQEAEEKAAALAQQEAEKKKLEDLKAKRKAEENAAVVEAAVAKRKAENAAALEKQEAEKKEAEAAALAAFQAAAVAKQKAAEESAALAPPAAPLVRQDAVNTPAGRQKAAALAERKAQENAAKAAALAERKAQENAAEAAALAARKAQENAAKLAKYRDDVTIGIAAQRQAKAHAAALRSMAQYDKNLERAEELAKSGQKARAEFYKQPNRFLGDSLDGRPQYQQLSLCQGSYCKGTGGRTYKNKMRKNRISKKYNRRTVRKKRDNIVEDNGKIRK